MRNDSKNEKEWITLKEAAKCSIYSKKTSPKISRKRQPTHKNKKDR